MSIVTLDLNSEAQQQSQTYSTEPASPLPRIWIGFVLAFGFLVAEIIEVMQGNEAAIGSYTLIVGIAGWIHWLSCIHRFHKILHQISPRIGGESTYPITPNQAVKYHFIPFFNLYWFFKWPREFSQYMNTNTSVKMAPGTGLGLILFLSVLTMRMVDGFIGLTLMFGFALYFQRKLRSAVAEHETTRGAVEVFA